MAMKQPLCRDLVGCTVKLVRRIRARGGTTFKAGRLYFVCATWRGRFTLAPAKSLRKPGCRRMNGIRGIERAAFVLACRVCGCTDDDCRQCVEKTGGPCHWVEPDLCSACADEQDRELGSAIAGEEGP